MATARRLVVLGVLLLAVAMAGCAGLGGTGDDADPDDQTEPGGEIDLGDYDAEQLQADAVAATGDSTTYAFDFDQCLTTRSDQGALRLGVEGDGETDAPERLSRIDVAMTLGLTCGEDARRFPSEAYHVQDALHEREGSEWNTTNVDEFWQPTDQDVALLDGATVTAVGTETIAGRETVLLDVDPASNETIAAYGLHPAVINDLLQAGVEIRSANVTQYVAAESPRRVLRTEIELTAVSGGNEFTGNLTTTYDYGADVAIELPEAIEE